jgi:BMFP domain-containing protein YqiC
MSGPERPGFPVEMTCQWSGRAMTQTSNRLFDEMTRLMNDATSVAQGVKREAEGVFRSQMERIVADLDLVKREDFEVVREMAAQAKAENEALKKRIEALEGMLGERTP